MGTRFLLFLSIITLLLCASSCTTANKITYFQNAPDTTFQQPYNGLDAPIQYNDILNITISSRSSEASLDFNKPAISQTKGYFVNSNGNIQLPILGYIQAVGYTKKQLETNIVNLINSKKLLLDPIVEVRHLNFEITVLGEVGHPSVISVPNEQISLIKALGMAGDLTINGKRNNVLLIRDENGVRITRRIDLTSSNFLNSEYYYLKPNDVLYVEANKAKIASAGRTQQILPAVLTGVSLLFLVLDRVIK
jgi:polysaccharide biosynthesis/export protein